LPSLKRINFVQIFFIKQFFTLQFLQQSVHIQLLDQRHIHGLTFPQNIVNGDFSFSSITIRSSPLRSLYFLYFRIESAIPEPVENKIYIMIVSSIIKTLLWLHTRSQMVFMVFLRPCKAFFPGVTYGVLFFYYTP
jgi:hypothetical protein